MSTDDSPDAETLAWRRPAPVDPDEDELARRWSLTPSDLAVVAECRGDDHRRRFAVQLCWLRVHGRFLDDYQRAEIKDALALLRLAACPDDYQSDEAFRRVCNSPPRGLGPKALEEISDEAAFRGVSLLRALETANLPPKAKAAAHAFSDAVRGVAQDRSATLDDQLSLLLDRTGYRTWLRESRAEETTDRLENLQELLSLAGGFHNATQLLEHAALASAAPGEDTMGRVQLMTKHKAKGLEFPHVFLAGWDSNCFPSRFGDHDEERRLAYVSLTRGKQRVSISHCAYRAGTARPSPFIDDIPEQSRIKGWLHGERVPTTTEMRMDRKRRTQEELAALLRR